MTERPKGVRFSQLYVQKGPPTSDSGPARVRLIAFLNEHLGYESRRDLAGALKRELGITVSTNLAELKAYPIHSFLDAVTVVHGEASSWMAPKWVDFVNRVFKEENLGYDVDESGGVHLLIDAEFSQNLYGTIRGLENSRFVAASNTVHGVQAALDSGEFRLAVREVFDATENIFKTVFGKPQLLGTSEIRTHLAAAIQGLYADTALHASNKAVDAFADWVSAAHFYRHAPGHAEPPPPPAELAVLLVSTGLAYIRWLLDIDRALTEQAKNP